MSIEALNWARKIYVGDSLAKALLRGIADYADENGHCFPSHARLSLDCEMSVATVKRRLAQLEDLDLLVTFRCWVDENGVRNREKRGRETSREIRLSLDKRIDPPAPQEDEAGSPEEFADFLEVTAALRTLPEYQNVEEIRLKKHAERGGFEKRLILKGEKG